MQIYVRKAGVDVKGIADSLNLHDPIATKAEVLQFRPITPH
jgi:hypothetical protein